MKNTFVKAKKATFCFLVVAACLELTKAFQASPLKFASNVGLSKNPSSGFAEKIDFRMNPLGLANNPEGRQVFKIDPVVKKTSSLTRSLSWFSWWSQLILTTVAAVTLVFSRNVIKQSRPSGSSTLPNFLLAGGGIACSCVSIFWTWASRRLGRRLVRKPTSRVQCANMLRKTVDVGVAINLIGMLITIVGAEQIVGSLAIKVLTTPRNALATESSSLLQPLDILVVQANTNTLFSHFTSLVALLYLSRQLKKLDPPSVEGDKRAR
eukprot:scaffold1375_cov137-Cylindrotheca_fusiformis.AAC.19